MNPANVDIERIVREVMRRLSIPENGGGRQPIGAGTERGLAGTGRLDIEERIVTLAALDGKLGNVRELAVTDGAIVTPSVRDELKRRKIRLTFANSPPTAQTASQGTLLVAGYRTEFDVDSLCIDLRRLAIDVENCPATTRLASTVEYLRSRVEQRVAVVLTAVPYAVACAANRFPEIRAATVVEWRDCSAAIATLAANVLVVDPTRCGIHRLRNLARQFARSKAGCCPEELM